MTEKSDDCKTVKLLLFRQYQEYAGYLCKLYVDWAIQAFIIPSEVTQREMQKL